MLFVSYLHYFHLPLSSFVWHCSLCPCLLSYSPNWNKCLSNDHLFDKEHNNLDCLSSIDIRWLNDCCNDKYGMHLSHHIGISEKVQIGSSHLIGLITARVGGNASFVFQSKIANELRPSKSLSETNKVFVISGHYHEL